jgi:hypothetical protein
MRFNGITLNFSHLLRWQPLPGIGLLGRSPGKKQQHEQRHGFLSGTHGVSPCDTIFFARNETYGPYIHDAQDDFEMYTTYLIY